MHFENTNMVHKDTIHESKMKGMSLSMKENQTQKKGRTKGFRA